jgi:hypothetical protein
MEVLTSSETSGGGDKMYTGSKYLLICITILLYMIYMKFSRNHF